MTLLWIVPRKEVRHIDCLTTPRPHLENYHLYLYENLPVWLNEETCNNVRFFGKRSRTKLRKTSNSVIFFGILYNPNWQRQHLNFLVDGKRKTDGYANWISALIKAIQLMDKICLVEKNWYWNWWLFLKKLKQCIWPKHWISITIIIKA